MDKDRKLRRYRRKDYRETVSFPVEIVGRDGHVRHYDFEESVRLYQRRMTWAALRFHDEDLVAAELGHCRARIEQLRRSYFQRHGWTAGPGERSFEQAWPEHAGELAAFLVRVLGERSRLDVRFRELGRDGEAEVWHLSPGADRPGLLLYAFVGETAAEAPYQRRLRSLSPAASGGDAERLVAHHASADCAFVLTGRGAEVAALAAGLGDPSDPGEAGPGVAEVAELVRRGELPAAFLRCRALLGHQPWHREAYVLGAALAVLLRRPAEAEDLAFVGARYFPDEPLLPHYLGLARLHQGRADEARDELRRAVVGSSEPAATLALLVLAESRRGLHGAVAAASTRPVGEGPEAIRLRRVLALVRARLLAESAGVGGVGVAALALGAGSAPAVLASLAWTLSCGAAVMLLRRRLDEVAEGHLFEDPEATLRRVRRAGRGRPEA